MAAPTWGQELEPADLEAVKLFDSVGFPSLEDKPYVKVNAGGGGCARCPGRGRRATWRFGFLLEDTKETFTVVHDTWPVVYHKGNAAKAGASFDEVDFKADALRNLGTRNFRPSYMTWSNLVRNRARPSQNLNLFLLGRAALQLGFKSEAAQLFAQARSRRPSTYRSARARMQARGQPTQPVRPQDEVPLKQMLERDMPKVLFWTTVDACGDRWIPRTLLLERFRLIIERYPESRERKDAEVYVQVLERMVQEESLSGTPSQREQPELGEELIELNEPIDDLVFSLRDLHAGHPVYHNSVAQHLLEKGTPSHELYELGPIAIPTLLKLAEDDRLTRIVNLYPRRGHIAGYVLRYRDVALELLAKHSGRRFASMEDAVDWWERVQLRGREAVLEEMILEGRSDACDLARRLLEVDRHRAITAAMKAAKGRTGRDRERLVSFVAAQTSPAANAFLLDEVRAGPDLRSRLAAARTLQRRGYGGWSEPLVCELGRVARARAVDSSRTSRDVIRFVVAEGSVRSLDQLRRLYDDLSQTEKRNLLESLAKLPRDHSDRSAIGEATLAGALDDTSYLPSRWRWERVTTNDPQLAEMAAIMLAHRLDTTFDMAARPFDRRRRMVEIGNLWRGLRGLPLQQLPIPPAPPEQAAPEVLLAAEAALLRASWPEEIEVALETYEELGLSGMKSLARVVDMPSLKPEAKTAAQQLLHDIASTVSEIRVTDEAGVLSEEDLAAFQPLVGAPLESRNLIELFNQHVDQRRAAVLELSMHRDGGGRGVSLEINLRPTARRNTARVTYSLRVGKVFNQGSYYVGARSKTNWNRFESRLTRLLDGNLTLDGELRLRVTGQR